MSIGSTPGGVEIAAWIFKARPDESARRRMMQVRDLRDKAKQGVKRVVRRPSDAR